MGYCSGRAASCLVLALTLVLAGRAAWAGDLIDLTDPSWADPWEDDAEGPYVSLESFPLPTVRGIDGELLLRLSDEVGVGGTSIAGIRLKVGLPRGYQLESIRLCAADATFLVKDRPFLSRVGDFFVRVARFLLLGRMVSAGSSLEIPAEAWYVLFEAAPLSGPSVTLHTEDEVEVDRGDANLTDHGTFQVCRLLLAANSFSELVNVRITVRNPRTQDVVRYHVPRLKLPLLPAEPPEGETPPAKLSARFDLEIESPRSER
jgi:hypothetical protein